jgi:hypothetical protein
MKCNRLDFLCLSLNIIDLYIILQFKCVVREERFTYQGSYSQLFIFFVCYQHRHLSIIDCFKVYTTCLVCFISTVHGQCRREEKEVLKDRR